MNCPLGLCRLSLQTGFDPNEGYRMNIEVGSIKITKHSLIEKHGCSPLLSPLFKLL